MEIVLFRQNGWLSRDLNISGLGMRYQLTIRALHPLLVDATRHPSVVAIGTWYFVPSIRSGPATPTGTGM